MKGYHVSEFDRPTEEQLQALKDAFNSPSKQTTLVTNKTSITTIRCKKRPGRIVKITAGAYKDKQGVVYNDEKPIRGDLRVHLVNNVMSFTGTRPLIDPNHLETIGNID